MAPFELDVFKAEFRVKFDLTYVVPIPADLLSFLVDAIFSFFDVRPAPYTAPHTTLAL